MNNNKENTKGALITKSQKKLLLSSAAILLSVAILVGGALFTVSLVRESNALVSYGGARMDEGVTHFLLSSFKYDYMVYLKESGVCDVADSEYFWGSYTVDNQTYLELLEMEAESYVRQVAAGSYLFDRYSRLSSGERRKIRQACQTVLDYKASGSESVFNKMTASYGFDYDDFLKGSELIYKAKMAENAIFGEGGSALSAGNMTEECNKFYDKYSHVLLLMVRTEDDFVTDAEGNRVKGDDGRDEMVSLSPSQREARLADIATIRSLIEAVGTGAESYMSPGAFRSWIDKYNYDPENAKSGYYFHRGSEYTSEFSDAFPTVVSRAIAMEVGSFAEIELDGGVTIFLYKQENEPLAYYSSSYSRFFTDFFSLASDYLYIESLNALAKETVVKDAFYDIPLDLLPYNYDFYPDIK